MFQFFENLFSDPNHFQVLALFRIHFFLCFPLKDFKKCVLRYFISKLKSAISPEKVLNSNRKRTWPQLHVSIGETSGGVRLNGLLGGKYSFYLFSESTTCEFIFFICQAIYIYFILQLFSAKTFYRFSFKLHQSKCENFRMVQVIYQTRETVFHRDIQTPRRELQIRRATEYF